MPRTILLFASLFCVALASGGAFVVWLVYDPASATGVFWVPLMQHAILVMRPLAIVLNLGLLLTVISAVLSRRDRRRFYLLLGASGCLLAAVAVTVIGNWPINGQIGTWNPAAPPPHWTQLRDQWWLYHRARAAFLMVGLGCAVAATLAEPDTRTLAAEAIRPSV